MNILSLFDGISAAQVALNNLGVTNYNYYSSEIDKWAIAVTQKNYPNTIQLGDVSKLKEEGLPDIDLLIGGSPCQGFSAAGKLNRFKDERSKLLFEYLRLLEEVKPRYYLLENVFMDKMCENEINTLLNRKPLKINSRFFSAQSRWRNYWTNIPFNFSKFPVHNKVTIKDILDTSTDLPPNPLNQYKKLNKKLNSKDGLIQVGMATNIKELESKKRVYSIYGKSPTVLANKPHILIPHNEKCNDNLWRKLTPIEYERLQTFPDNYTNGISKTQRNKALGNSFTVKAIEFLLNPFLQMP